MAGLQYIAGSEFTGAKADGLPMLLHKLPVAKPARRFVAKGLVGASGTSVASWKDVAGSGTILAPEASTAPKIGSVAGVRSVVFNGTSDGLSQQVSLPNPNTLVLVANILTLNTTANVAIAGASKTAADGGQILAAVKELYVNAGTNARVGVGLHQTGWRVYVISFNGANTVVNINGTEYTVTAGSLPRELFTLGFRQGADFANIAVAEAALYAGAMSSTERAATVVGLRAVYGF